MPSLTYLRAEAKRQGLTLSEDDLYFIWQRLEDTKSALARERPRESDGLEPPYCFVIKPKGFAGDEVGNRHDSKNKDASN